MRCEDLTRKLASPTGAPSPAEMAGHLAACPACAEWSRHATRFDRIWEATRPPGPSMDALDALWARASLALDEVGVEAPATIEFARPDRRRRWAMAAFAVAQAAALLVAALVLARRDAGKPLEVAVKAPAEDQAFVLLDLPVVEDDHLMIVRIDAKGKAPKVEMQDQSRLYAWSSLSAFTPHDEVGDMEARAPSLDVVPSP